LKLGNSGGAHSSQPEFFAFASVNCDRGTAETNHPQAPDLPEHGTASHLRLLVDSNHAIRLFQEHEETDKNNPDPNNLQRISSGSALRGKLSRLHGGLRNAGGAEAM
jgi:hypothetical protein